jgi:hypothetical protein
VGKLGGEIARTMAKVRRRENEKPDGWSGMALVVLTAMLLACMALTLRQHAVASYALSKPKKPGDPTFKYELQCAARPERQFDAGGKVGFVFSATDRYATAMAYRCVAAIESLVRVGGWSGPVYLMTNKGQECLDESHLRRVSGSVNVHVVNDFYSVLRAMGDVFPNLPRSFSPGSAKSVKGAMIDIVGKLHSAGGIEIGPSSRERAAGQSAPTVLRAPGEAPDVLIFHDCDKVVARTGCIEEMLSVPLPFGPEKRFYVSHMEPNCIRANNGSGPCGDNLHAGVVAVHRKWSLPIARAWAHKQLLNGKRYDRHTLWDAWNSSRGRDGATAWRMASLPAIYQDSMWDASKPAACINHVSGGRCVAAGQKRARAFMRSLCLEAEPHSTCKHRGTVDDWCGWDKPS